MSWQAVDIVLLAGGHGLQTQGRRSHGRRRDHRQLHQRRHPHHRATWRWRELLRKKSQFVIAFGSCAHTGGIPGLANLHDREEIFRAVYLESVSTVNAPGTMPETTHRENGFTVTLPGFYNTVRTLDRRDRRRLLRARLPADAEDAGRDRRGAAYRRICLPRAPCWLRTAALCETCSRKDSKPDKLLLKEYKRPHQVILDEETCLLAQGVICLGPATRSRLRDPLHQRQHAVHRLFRTHQPRAWITAPRP